MQVSGEKKKVNESKKEKKTQQKKNQQNKTKTKNQKTKKPNWNLSLHIKHQFFITRANSSCLWPYHLPWTSENYFTK